MFGKKVRLEETCRKQLVLIEKLENLKRGVYLDIGTISRDLENLRKWTVKNVENCQNEIKSLKAVVEHLTKHLSVLPYNVPPIKDVTKVTSLSITGVVHPSMVGDVWNGTQKCINNIPPNVVKDMLYAKE